MHIPRLPDVHAVPLDRLACRAAPEDAELPDSPSHPNDNTEQQQNQRSEPSQPSSSLSHQDDPQQLLHSESAQQPDPQAAVQQQQQSGRYSPEHQLLKTAMKKLQALEAYQQLLSSSSGPDEKQLQRKAGDSPAEVSAKLAANKDELPLLDAAILIAQVRISSRWSSQNKGSIANIKAVHMHVWSAAASSEDWPSQAVRIGQAKRENPCTDSNASYVAILQLPLCNACLQHAYPDLDASSVRQQLDKLAAEVEAAGRISKCTGRQ
jgi:hypothetical protein